MELTTQRKQTIIDKIKSEIVDIKDDGSIFLNQKYFKYTYGLRMINEKNLMIYLDLSLRKEEEEITQTHCNLALAIQKVTEEIVIKIVKETKRIN